MVLNKKVKVLSLFELFKSVPTILIDWKKKTPYQMFCFMYSIGRTVYLPVGLPLYEEDQTIRWYSYGPYASVLSYATLCMYTAFYHGMNGHIEKFLPSTCLVTSIASYIPFAWSCLSEERLLNHSMVTFAGRYIYEDNHDDTEHNRTCTDRLTKDIKGYTLKVVALLTGGGIAFYGTFYYSYMAGVRSTMIEVKVPFALDNSELEYLFNLIFQFMVYCYGGLVYAGIETAMSIFQNVVNITPSLIKNRHDELNRMHVEKGFSEFKTQFAAVDITKQMLDYEKFVICLRDISYWRTLITPIMFIYSIAMSIFCQYSMGFPSGYGIAMMSWIQFYYICDTGQSVEDNGLDEIIYNSYWYALPCEVQKDLMMLIHQRQNRATLGVGPFGTVNRNLFKNVTNNIYTLLMFLLNFVE